MTDGPGMSGAPADGTEADTNSGVMEASDRQRLVERIGAAMYDHDIAAQSLGMKLVSILPGAAEMTMRVRDDMVNGHNIGHGGLTFALADTALAYASNSYNQRSVAQMAQISFIAATHTGDLLTARAVELSRQGRTGIYDVSVHNGDGELVAVFRGQTRTIKGQISADLPVLDVNSEK